MENEITELPVVGSATRERRSLLTSQNTAKRERKTARRPSPRLHVKGYDIGRTLGEGAFGKVKYARRSTGGQGLVVKIMEKQGIDDLKRVDQIFGEMFILTSLRHKNVIQLYDVVNQFNYIILVMEYAEGGELAKLIEKKLYLHEAYASRLFCQILDGLIYCHRLKVIHRDLKLENILLDSEGNIKIVDFGLSERLLGDAMLDSVCGTPLYMSPELMRGEKYDGSTDVWSLGVVLYAMVCGFLPFHAKSLADLSAKVCGGFYTIPKFISDGLQDLISSMLAVKPTDRLALESIQNHPWAMTDIMGEERKEKAKLSFSALEQMKKECHQDAEERLARKKSKTAKFTPSGRKYVASEPNTPSIRSPRSPRTEGGDDSLSKLVKNRGMLMQTAKKNPRHQRRASLAINGRRSPGAPRRRWKSPSAGGISDISPRLVRAATRNPFIKPSPGKPSFKRRNSKPALDD